MFVLILSKIILKCLVFHLRVHRRVNQYLLKILKITMKVWIKDLEILLLARLLLSVCADEFITHIVYYAQDFMAVVVVVILLVKKKVVKEKRWSITRKFPLNLLRLLLALAAITVVPTTVFCLCLSHG